MSIKTPHMNKTRYICVDPDQAGRRIDNFLISQLKGVPKTRIYQMLRRGEVRINQGRIKQDYRVRAGDSVRLPPSYVLDSVKTGKPPLSVQKLLLDSILYEDEYMMILNKPAGMAVHGGSKQNFGLIEALRETKDKRGDLELVHRLDKATSGCLIISKNHITLRKLNRMLQQGEIRKNYLALLHGSVNKKELDVKLPLGKNESKLYMGKIKIDYEGKKAHTKFSLLENFGFASLVEIYLLTGRTHQIRVHAAHINHPVAGDDRYGRRDFNKTMKRFGLSRLFLHAGSLSFNHPVSNKKVSVNAPLPEDLSECLIYCKKGL